jgi:riboflavin biosynthesis pyrimidine reductase
MLRISPLPQKTMSEQDFTNAYSWPNKTWLRANMVQALNGSVVDKNQGTLLLSSDIDKKVFRLLRQLCDVILVGAKTAQSAPYLHIKINEENQILRKNLKLSLKPRVAIVSNQLNLSKEWLKQRIDEQLPLIYTSQSMDSNIRPFIGLAEFVFCGQREVDLPSVKKDLVRRSFKRILCEGGPTLLHGLFEKHLIDELDLTIETNLPFTSALNTVVSGKVFSSPIKLNPVQVFNENQTVLVKYLVERT